MVSAISVLKLEYHGPLSNFAFKFNFRHYNVAEEEGAKRGEGEEVDGREGGEGGKGGVSATAADSFMPPKL